MNNIQCEHNVLYFQFRFFNIIKILLFIAILLMLLSKLEKYFILTFVQFPDTDNNKFEMKCFDL